MIVTTTPSVEGKKIVIVGGSSVAFGFDSQKIEQAFPGYKVVNFGLYADLGTKVMLDLSEDHISEGDIVIVARNAIFKHKSYELSTILKSFLISEQMWQEND